MVDTISRIKELEKQVKFLESLLKDRFWSKVKKTDSCWNWTGHLVRGGYGRYIVALGSKPIPAHRVSYQLTFGEIPKNLVIDHLCRNPKCVNPEHLEAVTQQINILRGVSPAHFNALKTHCKRGHEFNEENTIYRSNSNRKTRDCKLCNLIRNKNWRGRQK